MTGEDMYRSFSRHMGVTRLVPYAELYDNVRAAWEALAEEINQRTAATAFCLSMHRERYRL